MSETIANLLAESVVAGPTDPFLLWGESWTSFAEFDLQVRRFAGALRALGVTKGDRVAILMDNRPEHLIAAYGAMLAGVVFVPVNTHLSPEEAAYVVSHAGARLLVTEARHLLLAGKIPAWPGLELVVSAPPREHETAVGNGVEALDWKDFLGAPAVAPDVTGDDLAVIQYTSGTTARPKGAMLAQGALVRAFRARARALEYDARDTMLIVTPLFHLNAQSVVMMGLARHFRVVLRERFSASRFWGDVNRHGVTTFNGMQAIARILMARDPDPDERSNPMRKVVAVLGPELHRAFEERFGVTLVPVYGLTEDPMPVLAPAGGFSPDSDKLASSGRPVDPEAHRIRIVDDAGRNLPVGSIGEIVKQSPVMMRGYYKDDEATAAALRDGWLYTGDLGYLDADGFLYFAGRKKDVIRRSGEMISAAEVEMALVAHPAIAEAAVVGVPDPVRGEELKAAIILKEGCSRHELPPEEILKYCSQRLAPFKVPRFVEYLLELPRTATLKIRKDALQAAGPHFFDREGRFRPPAGESP